MTWPNSAPTGSSLSYGNAVIRSAIVLAVLARLQFEAAEVEQARVNLIRDLDRLIIERPPLDIEVEHRSEDGFPIIPAETVQSHRNSETLISYFENADSGKPQVQMQMQVQVRIDPMIPNPTPIQVQQSRVK